MRAPRLKALGNFCWDISQVLNCLCDQQRRFLIIQQHFQMFVDLLNLTALHGGSSALLPVDPKLMLWPETADLCRDGLRQSGGSTFWVTEFVQCR